MSVSDEPLKLRAADLEDLSVIAAMAQDALVAAVDIDYLPAERQFVMLLNRFRWERAGDAGPFERVHAGLRFDAVNAVRSRGVERGQADRMMALLTIAYDSPEEGADGHVHLQFAGGGAIRLTVERLSCALEDVGDPWPTKWKPGHEGAGGA